MITPPKKEVMVSLLLVCLSFCEQDYSIFMKFYGYVDETIIDPNPDLDTGLVFFFIFQNGEIGHFMTSSNRPVTRVISTVLLAMAASAR